MGHGCSASMCHTQRPRETRERESGQKSSHSSVQPMPPLAAVEPPPASPPPTPAVSGTPTLAASDSSSEQCEKLPAGRRGERSAHVRARGRPDCSARRRPRREGRRRRHCHALMFGGALAHACRRRRAASAWREAAALSWPRRPSRSRRRRRALAPAAPSPSAIARTGRRGRGWRRAPLARRLREARLGRYGEIWGDMGRYRETAPGSAPAPARVPSVAPPTGAGVGWPRVKGGGCVARSVGATCTCLGCPCRPAKPPATPLPRSPAACTCLGERLRGREDGERLVLLPAREGVLPRRALEQHHPQAPPVRRARGASAPQLLRRSVLPRAHRGHRAAFRAEVHRRAKVAQQGVALPVQQHVLRLQVSVGEAQVVNVLEHQHEHSAEEDERTVWHRAGQGLRGRAAPPLVPEEYAAHVPTET